MLVFKKKHFDVWLNRFIKSKKIVIFSVIFLSLIILLLSSVYLGAYLYKIGTITETKKKIYAGPIKLKTNFTLILIKSLNFISMLDLKSLRGLNIQEKKI